MIDFEYTLIQVFGFDMPTWVQLDLSTLELVIDTPDVKQTTQYTVNVQTDITSLSITSIKTVNIYVYPDCSVTN